MGKKSEILHIVKLIIMFEKHCAVFNTNRKYVFYKQINQIAGM